MVCEVSEVVSLETDIQFGEFYSNIAFYFPKGVSVAVHTSKRIFLKKCLIDHYCANEPQCHPQIISVDFFSISMIRQNSCRLLGCGPSISLVSSSTILMQRISSGGFAACTDRPQFCADHAVTKAKRHQRPSGPWKGLWNSDIHLRDSKVSSQYTVVIDHPQYTLETEQHKSLL